MAIRHMAADSFSEIGMCFEKYSKHGDSSLGMARTLCLQAEYHSQPPASSRPCVERHLCMQQVVWVWVWVLVLTYKGLGKHHWPRRRTWSCLRSAGRPSCSRSLVSLGCEESHHPWRHLGSPVPFQRDTKWLEVCKTPAWSCTRGELSPETNLSSPRCHSSRGSSRGVWRR